MRCFDLLSGFYRWLSGESKAPDPPTKTCFIPTPRLAASLRRLDGRVPQAIRQRLETLLVQAETRLAAEQGGSHPYAEHLARSILDRYVPDLLESFLKIPAAEAWSTGDESSGKTPLNSLAEQLDLLARGLQEAENPLDPALDLYIHERFLKNKLSERLGSHSLFPSPPKTIKTHCENIFVVQK